MCTRKTSQGLCYFNRKLISAASPWVSEYTEITAPSWDQHGKTLANITCIRYLAKMKMQPCSPSLEQCCLYFNKCCKPKTSYWRWRTGVKQGSMRSNSTVHTFPQCLYLVSLAPQPHLEVFVDLFVVVFVAVRSPSLAPCCFWYWCNYSVVWEIFGLTCCAPFTSQDDRNKGSITVCHVASVIALEVYILVFTELDYTVSSL